MPTTSDVPATTYVALLTTNAGAGDDISVAVEASYTNYTRPNIASSVGWNAPANGTTGRQITNKLAFNFGTAGSGPTTITGFALCKNALGDGAVTVAGEIIYANLV